jgi:hypothetical protein
MNKQMFIQTAAQFKHICNSNAWLLLYHSMLTLSDRTDVTGQVGDITGLFH